MLHLQINCCYFFLDRIEDGFSVFTCDRFFYFFEIGWRNIDMNSGLGLWFSCQNDGGLEAFKIGCDENVNTRSTSLAGK